MAAPDLARELRLESPLVIDDPATPLPLPHADGTVDALVVAGPLQRAEDPTAWAAELRRVVRPDGAVLALAPDAGRRVWNDPELRRPFTAKSLRLLFADHGFAIVASGRRDGDLWVHARREDASAEAQDAGGYFDWHKEPGYFRDVTRHFAPTDRVLDVGCGTAWLGDHFSDYVGIDSSEDAIRAARARGRDARVHRVDEPLPFDDASFDGVVAKDLLEHADGLVGVDAALHEHRERLTGELIDHVEQPQHAAIGGLVGLEVQRPHVVGTLRPEPPRRHGRVPEPLALAGTPRHPQALLAPQSLHPLAVHRPALLAQPMMRLAVAPARALRAERAQPRTQRLIVGRPLGLMTLRRAVLTDEPARPALGDAQAVAKHRDRLTPPGRAHQFPFATSFKASMLSAWSATIRFNLAFSRSSSLSRLTSSAFIPPYWRCQR